MYHRSGHQTWTPPLNFAMVETGIYRSAYPALANVPYLKHIGIKTVVLLSIEMLPGPVTRALLSSNPAVFATNTSSAISTASDGTHVWKAEDQGATPIRIVCTADLTEWMNEYSWAQDDFTVSDVQHALDFALQKDFQPVLFACPTGELQTSVVVGCMRRYQGWTVAAALAECDLFVNMSQNVRTSIMTFIERWNLDEFPVRETDIANRKRELLVQDHQHYHNQNWRRKDVIQWATDTDSDNDDTTTYGSSKTGYKNYPELATTYSGDSMVSRKFSTTRIGAEEGIPSTSPVTVQWAPWFTAALRHRATLSDAIIAARVKVRGLQDPMPEPHERYLGVRNPPSLDGRSTFTKESVVEEDDD